MSREIVIVMGYNASGKSSTVVDYTNQGYHRLNRDLEGGTMDALHQKAQQLLKSKAVNKLVLDNTYPSVESRQAICQIAKAERIPIRCVWLTTSFEDSQLNACIRMVRLFGKLPSVEEIKKSKNPNIFPPAALYHYRKVFEKPTKTEGFSEIVEVSFDRHWPLDYTNKAVIVDYDGTVRDSGGREHFPLQISDVKARKNVTPILNHFKQNGYVLLGASNQSGVAKKVLTDDVCRQCFDETNRQLGLDIDYMYCPHSVPPITCFCRKPNPGIGAHFIVKYKLSPANCIMVGDMGSDKTFAERCGFKFVYAPEFFK